MGRTQHLASGPGSLKTRKAALACFGWFFLGALASGASDPALARETTLRQALGHTYETNPHLASQRAILRAEDEQVPQAKENWFRPTISAGGGAEWENQKSGQTFDAAAFQGNAVPYEVSSITPDFDLSLDFPIFRSGQTLYTIKVAEASIDVGQWNLVATEQDVLAQAASAYGHVILYRALVKISEREVKAYEPLLKMSRDMYQSRTATITDMAQVELELAESRANLANNRGTLETVEAAYEAIVGRTPGDLAPLPRLAPGVSSLEAAEERAMKLDPLIRSAKSTLQKSQHLVSERKTSLLPTVGLSASYQQSWDHYRVLTPPVNPDEAVQTSRVGSVGVMVTVPIYSGGIRYSYIRQSIQEESAARLGLRNTELVQLSSLRGLWQQRFAYEAALKAYDSAMGAAQTAVTGKIREYKNGTTSMQEVLLVQENLYGVLEDRASATYNLFFTEVSLLKSLGVLTAAGFELQVPRYDPEKNRKEVEDQWIGW
ncbi:MAG: TolC family protein [Myxococcota bacterium]|nr:TolC family protein [Myxococcota bacterium]